MTEYTPRKPRGGIPTPFRAPKPTPYRINNNKENVNSDDNSDSNASVESTPQLTVVAEFDDIIRSIKQGRNCEVEDIFLNIAIEMEDVRAKGVEAVQECRRLQGALEIKTSELSNMSSKLNQARALVDHERKSSRKVEEKLDLMEEQLAHVRDFLAKDSNQISSDNKDRLKFLNSISNVLNRDVPFTAPYLSAINEGNTTGSLLSDFSYSKSEDDLEVSNLHSKTWKKHRPSTGGPQVQEPCQKKRKSSSKVVEISHADTVRATTTLTVPKIGPITATSIIESVPAAVADSVPGNNQHKEPTLHSKSVAMHSQVNEQSLLTATPAPLQQLFSAWQQQHTLNNNNNNSAFSPCGILNRPHSLHHKTLVIPDTCTVCERRMGFGRGAFKCRQCRALVHAQGDCREKLPLPCVPVAGVQGQSPAREGSGLMNGTQNGQVMGLISDYTPIMSPMVPCLIVHCLKEIEARGFREVGIYRIPGSEREVKQLKERFMRGRGAPCLNPIDIHVLCGTVKDFLRSLSESLVTKRLWHSFINVIESKEDRSESEIVSGLKELIAILPQPNRDTLAYVLLHLKRVANEKECKMPISNLSKIFGPTIIGYSSMQIESANLYNETRQQVSLMEWLLNLSEDYWSSVLNIGETDKMRSNIQQTPSTDSLLRPTTTRMFFTPRSTRRPQKFFPTPP